MTPRLLLIPLFVLFGSLSFAGTNNSEDTIDPVELKATLQKSAQWHLENPLEWLGIRWWHIAPYYDGLLALSEATGEAKYLAAVINYGDHAGWALADRFYHADDHAVGHAWIDIYSMDPNQKTRLEQVIKRMDYVVEHPIAEDLKMGHPSKTDVTNRWTWCDALYMGPPTLTRLTQITGDQKYVRFMDYEYRKTYDDLWDPEEKLFFRDDRFIKQRTENGKKIFWSRGNGWVYGGLVQVLETLPQNDIARPFYEKLFLDMTDGILRAQQADGLWRPSLRDPEHINTGESSGTGFFLYGLAWGINNGYLDRATYWPKVVKGWNGLQSNIQPSGMIGYVQPVGASPVNNVTSDATQAYGAGALFLAGAEILKGLGAQSEKSSETRYAEAVAMLEAGAFDQTTSAYYMPRRADDIACENDKIAFRVYGPALKDSPENSGIDAWFKRVEKPVIQDWYEKDLSGQGSYHKDTGEGHDAYKVGPARGCGGTGIWYKGKLYTSNVFTKFDIKDTSADELVVWLEYNYSIEGKNIREEKSIRLVKGSNLCEGISRFKGAKSILDEAEFAIGLTAQSEHATTQSADSMLTMWDSLNGYTVGSAISIVNGIENDSITKRTVKKDTLLTAKLSSNTVSYLFGFAWERFSEFQTEEAWISYVKNSKGDFESHPISRKP